MVECADTTAGLSVHMNQVHKESLTAVDNALPNRANPDIEIFGMEGIPEDVVGAHNQRVLSQFQQAEAERRAVTGNSSLGGPGSGGPKKPKFESPAELKKRLAEHKAKMAEQATGGSSGGATPISPSISQSPAGPVSNLGLPDFCKASNTTFSSSRLVRLPTATASKCSMRSQILHRMARLLNLTIRPEFLTSSPLRSFPLSINSSRVFH